MDFQERITSDQFRAIKILNQNAFYYLFGVPTFYEDFGDAFHFIGDFTRENYAAEWLENFEDVTKLKDAIEVILACDDGLAVKKSDIRLTFDRIVSRAYDQCGFGDDDLELALTMSSFRQLLIVYDEHPTLSCEFLDEIKEIAADLSSREKAVKEGGYGFNIDRPPFANLYHSKLKALGVLITTELLLEGQFRNKRDLGIVEFQRANAEDYKTHKSMGIF